MATVPSPLPTSLPTPRPTFDPTQHLSAEPTLAPTARPTTRPTPAYCMNQGLDCNINCTYYTDEDGEHVTNRYPCVGANGATAGGGNLHWCPSTSSQNYKGTALS